MYSKQQARMEGIFTNDGWNYTILTGDMIVVEKNVPDKILTYIKNLKKFRIRSTMRPKLRKIEKNDRNKRNSR